MYRSSCRTTFKRIVLGFSGFKVGYKFKSILKARLEVVPVVRTCQQLLGYHFVSVLVSSSSVISFVSVPVSSLHPVDEPAPFKGPF